jgi:diaminopropionate ammonia-lyase
VAALGVRLLAQPLGDDPRLVSGESGAVGPGLLNAVMKNPELTPLREMMELGPDSVVWCVSTEGDTDPAGWRDIVHLGRWPWPEKTSFFS